MPPFLHDLLSSNGLLIAAGASVVTAMVVRLVPRARISGELATQIEERARIERALRRSERYYRCLLESGIIGVIITNRRGNIHEANPALLQMIGYTAEDVASGQLTWTALTPPEYAERDRRAVERVRETGAAPAWEKEYIRKDGSRVPVLVGVAALDQAAGEHIAFILDLTEQKRAEEAVRRIALQRDATVRLKDDAEAANAELEAFSYSVAHDLRTPLRAMNGYGTALLEDHGAALDDEAITYLTRIVEGAVRLDEIIDALLALSQLTRTEPARELVDLVLLGHAALEPLQASDASRTVRFVTPERLSVEGDPQLLRVLLDNLLGNAWKFTARQATARIELGCEEIDGATVYYVRDNGVGFDMTLASKLFVPFRRLHTHAEFAGTGIGLATVQRIVRRHGGQVWAQSASGEGATFYFSLSRTAPRNA